MEATVWIGAVTAVGNLVKSWLDARKSGLDLEKAKAAIAEKAQQPDPVPAASPKASGAMPGSGILIDPELLAPLVADITASKTRFAAVLADPQSTPDDVDAEQGRARHSVCKHIQRIQELNGGALPTNELQLLAASFGCGS